MTNFRVQSLCKQVLCHILNQIRWEVKEEFSYSSFAFLPAKCENSQTTQRLLFFISHASPCLRHLFNACFKIIQFSSLNSDLNHQPRLIFFSKNQFGSVNHDQSETAIINHLIVPVFTFSVLDFIFAIMNLTSSNYS